MPRKFQYKKRSFDAAKKRAEQSAGTRDNYILEDIPLYKPTEGENLIRILPPTWEEPNHYGMDIYVHYNVGPDSAAYLCLNKMKGEDCPICEERINAEHEGDKDYAKKLKPTKRVLFYLIDRDKEKEGLKAWASPWTVDKEIMIQATDSRTREFFPVDDPDEGFDVKVTRTGAAEQTKYSITIGRRSTSIELDDAVWDILEEHPIPDILIYHPYEHIAKVFEGTAAAGSDSNDASPKEQIANRRSKTQEKEKEEDEVDVTYNEVQDMRGAELDELVEKAGLDMDTSSFDTDQKLADAICDALGLQDTKETDPEPDPEPEKEPKKEEGTSRISSRLAGLRKRKSS